MVVLVMYFFARTRYLSCVLPPYQMMFVAIAFTIELSWIVYRSNYQFIRAVFHCLMGEAGIEPAVPKRRVYSPLPYH